MSAFYIHVTIALLLSFYLLFIFHFSIFIYNHFRELMRVSMLIFCTFYFFGFSL